MTDGGDAKMNRREFLARSATAAAAVAATGAAAWLLRDSVGPAAHPGAASVCLPDYSVPALAGRMAIATGADRAQTVRAAVEALGGMRQFVATGDRVLLKVNAAFATPPSLSATTHPQLVREVVRLCRDARAAEVIVTDNPINDPGSCFALTGIAQAAREAGAEVFLPRDDAFAPVTVGGARLIVDWPVLHKPLARANKLIGLAPVKHHERSGASMALKNWYGLLGGRRNIFHQDIHTIIAELARMVRPTLVVLDGTTTMVRNGPTGGSLDDLAETNTMIVSTDAVAADAFGATLLGKTAADLPYIGLAAAAGAGTADYESLRPLRVSVEPGGGA
ncbi:MAG: DUF362 domain-containing protein [Phycisphaerae bacterium]|nr:DUF362 domain-containing protein [Phycisphaerae bacterium]